SCDVASAVTGAQVRIHNRYGENCACAFSTLMQFELRWLERGAVSRSNFACDTEVTETVRPICCDIQLENPITTVRLQRIHGKSQVRQASPHLLGRLPDIEKFFEPVVTDLHQNCSRNRMSLRK